jgi:hypothetical protein
MIIQAELDAAKAMYNELLNNVYQLRSKNIILEKRLQNALNELYGKSQPNVASDAIINENGSVPIQSPLQE